MKNKLPMMLLALLAAIFIWLYDVTVVNPNDVDTFTAIPVTFENEEAIREQDLMMTSGSDVTVTLRISGRRSELKKLSRNNIQITVDLEQINEEGTHELLYSVRYPANVSSGDLSVENRTPAYVSVTVEHYIRQPVPVRAVFEGEGTTESNGESLVIDTDTMTITPSEVMITGPAALVETVDYARIVINKSAITETTVADYDYELMNAEEQVVSREELVTDVEKVSVSIPVLKYKEVPLVLKTTAGGGATGENISYTLSTESIKISGTAAAVDKINQIELGTLDFATVTGPTTKTYPIVLPEGVNNASGVVEVQASVRVNGLNVMTMSVSNFELINVPEGLTAQPISESVQLTLRGTPAALTNLKPEEVSVTVDLSSFTQPGTYIISVNVEVPDGLQVGPIGSNTLTVTLSE